VSNPSTNPVQNVPSLNYTIVAKNQQNCAHNCQTEIFPQHLSPPMLKVKKTLLSYEITECTLKLDNPYDVL